MFLLWIQNEHVIKEGQGRQLIFMVFFVFLFVYSDFTYIKKERKHPRKTTDDCLACIFFLHMCKLSMPLQVRRRREKNCKQTSMCGHCNHKTENSQHHTIFIISTSPSHYYYNNNYHKKKNRIAGPQ